MMMYDGLETCIINNQSLEEEVGTSRGDDECPAGSLDDDAFPSCSSSKDVFESFSSKLLPRKTSTDDWEFERSPKHLYGKEKPGYALCYSDNPVPTIIKDALPKSGKTSLGDDLYKMLASDSASVDEIFISLRLVTEHAALDISNRLEAAIYVWKERIAEQARSGKSPVRASWSLVKDSLSEISHIELLINRSEMLNDQIKYKFSNLPQSFLDATQIQYGKDIGHAILEAYSQILANLGFRSLSRIEEILQEDALSNPNSPGSNELFRTPDRLIYNMNKSDDVTKTGPGRS